jgi:hypothetical protein
MIFTGWSGRLVAAVLVLALCGAPRMLSAWQQPTAPSAGGETQAAPATTPAPASQVPATGTPAQSTTAPAQQGTAPGQTGTTVDPSQGPLQPAPTDAAPAPEALPSAETSAPATGAQPSAQDDTVVEQLPDKPAPQKPAEPLGTATAQRGRTAGGAASKPAGTAIAPAKQRQVRSILIKLGAIAGAGIALGTVYMLTRGTSSRPPGAGTLP